jgi:glycerol uptake facilitator-like aquaporin
MEISFSRRLVAEFVGTAALLAVVVGSGIMGETLADGNVALALLGNTLATGAILVVLILIFDPVSGGYFNPAVTVSFLLRKEINGGEAGAYIVVQLLGGLIGVVIAHAMFDQSLFMLSTKVRTGFGQWTADPISGCIAIHIGTAAWCHRRHWVHGLDVAERIMNRSGISQSSASILQRKTV